MKNIFTLLFVVVAFQFQGQTKLGLSLSGGISDVSSNDQRVSYPAITDIQSEFGYTIGLDIEVPLNQRWYFTSRLDWQPYGFSEKLNTELVDLNNDILEFFCNIPENVPEGIAPVKHRFGFLQIPIMANFIFNEGCEECGWQWFLGLGPTFNLSLNHAIKTPLIDGDSYQNVDCLVRQSVIVGLQAEIGTTYQFPNNPNQLRFTLFYNGHFQSLYEHPLNYNLGMGGLRVAYLFALAANK
jgi:hypothetical protein